MRAIKFRAWDGEKMRDDFALIDGVAHFEENPAMDSPVVTVETKHGRENYYYEWAMYKPKPKWKAMQFTGLTDRNAVEIYEGDIIKFNCWSGGVAAVRFMIGGFNFNANGTIESLANPDITIEVIGNIYEHEHLLERES